MPAVSCPACGGAVAPDDVNVGEGVAYCRGCGEVARLSEIAAGGAASGVAITLQDVPPKGCRVEDDGVTMRVIASARSLGGALAGTFFAVFWNSIVGVFVGVVLATFWVRFVGPLPSWAPLTSPANMPLFMAFVLTVFLIPFVCVGVIVAGATVVCIAGHVTVTIRDGVGTVFVGVGPVGWRRRFDALAVTSVRVVDERSSESRSTNLVIEADRTVKFASGLPAKRRAWMALVLRAVLVPGGGGRRSGATLHIPEERL